MADWFSFPFNFPTPDAICWVRVDRWSGSPFKAIYDFTNQNWIAVNSGIIYPQYMISRWSYVDENDETAFFFSMQSDGDGSGVRTFYINVVEADSISVFGNAYFYDDSSGTVNPNQIRSLPAYTNQVLYLKVLSGFCLLVIPNGKTKLYTLYSYSSTSNQPIINVLNFYSNMPEFVQFIWYVGIIVNFNTSELPSSIDYIGIDGHNTIFGSLNSLPSLLGYFYIDGDNTISGDIADLPAPIHYFYLSGYNSVSLYSGKTWTTKPATFSLLGLASLSSSDVDSLLIDFDTDLAWSAGDTITIQGNCSPRTSASDAAVSNMISEGATILTN